MRNLFQSNAVQPCGILSFAKRAQKIRNQLFVTAFGIVLVLWTSIPVFSQNVNVNPGAGTYATLKDAFDAINLGTHTGAITIDIVGSTTETVSAVLNASGGTSSYTSILIQPSGGAARTISGSFMTSNLIDLNGADAVTIDGLNSGGNSLTISYTATGPANAIRFINDASNNIIQNCTLQGSASTAANGVVFFSTGASTGNDGNNINNCNITAAGANLPINGIYSSGTSSAVDNSGNAINLNNISDYFNAGSSSQGINLSITGNSAWTITNNRLFQTANRIFTTSNTHVGILIAVGSGYTITGNIIGYANASGTGTTNLVGITTPGTFGGTFPSAYTIGSASLNATRYIAISCNFAAAGTISEIQNNTLAGFALLTSSGVATTNGIWCGINILGGNVNIGTTSGNTIGATTGNGSIYTACSSAGGAIVGIFATSVNTVTIQNNIIGAADAMATTNVLSGAFTGIDAAGAGGIFSISNNSIGNNSANNIRTGNLVTGTDLSNVGTTFQSTTGTTSPMVGIRSIATGNTVSITGNTLRGWATSCTAGAALTGIITSGTMTGTTPVVTVNSNFLGTAARDWMTYTVANAGTLTGISVANTVATMYSIQTNDFRGITYNVAGSGSHTYINLTGATAAAAAATIGTNTFTNLNVNTTGSITFISQSYTASATGTKTVNSNSIVTAFNKGSAGGSVIFVTDNGSSVTGAVSNCTSNNFSNVTLTGVTSITGLNYTDGGTAPTRSVTGNTLNNWTTGAATINAMNFTYWNGVSTLSTNTITNITGQGAITGISMGLAVNTATSIAISGNTITNLTSTGTGGNVTGIVCSNTSTGISFTGNIIGTLSSTSTTGTINGLTISGASSPTISKNKIYDLSGNQTGTIVNGINITSGTTLTISNNLIGDLRATSATGLNAINGINAGASSTYNVYYNTIYLNATSSSVTSFGNSCITFSSTATSLNSRNNILVNLSTPAQNGLNATANGIAACLRRSGGTLEVVPANYATTSNNNLYWVNPTAGTNNHLTYVEGTSTITNPMNTFALFRTFLVNRDQLSVTENPTFLSTIGSSSIFLHVDPAIGTQIEGGASTIGGITDDYDGDVRNVTTPDIGADEGTFIFADLMGPSISYTPLVNTACSLDRMLSSTITDASGVNAIVGTKPRLYFKKSTNANTYAGNTSADNGWKYVEATNASSPFSFTTNYALLQAPVVPTDVIQYFVVAQDLAGTPNIGIYSGTFTTQPSTVALVAGNFPLTGTINSYTILTPGLTGTVTIGASGTYPTLTGAGGLFSEINTKGLSGNLVAQIVDATLTENGTNTLNAMLSTGCSGGPFTLTIKPTVVTLLSGTNAGAIIRLNGADNVIIDGSIGSTANTVCPVSAATRDLTITNTNTGTSSAVVWLQTNGSDAATNNIVKNCNLVGNSNTTTLFGLGSGSSMISTTSLGTGNNNNSFVNNNLSKTQYGIYSQGASAANKNTGTIINQNLINTISPNHIAKGGIWTGFENNITISGNRIENLTSTSDLFAITLGIGNSFLNTTTAGNEVTNATITKNIINSISNTGTNSAAGIMLASATTGTTMIANNMIGGVSANGTGSDFCAGILLGGGTGATTNVYYNTVAMNGTIGGATAGTTQSFALAVTNTTAPTLDIRNNILINEQLPNPSGTTKFYAIGLAYSSTLGNYAGLTSNNNDLFAIAGANYALGITGGLSAGTVRATLAAWQTETGRDGVSVNLLPVFISSTNLHIDNSNPANLPLNDGAIAVSITDDIDCEIRMTDIGADEFLAASCTMAVGGTASGNTTFCGSGTPTITAAGYSSGIGSGYQWMSYANAGDPLSAGTPIGGQTNPATLTTGVVSDTTYYRLRVICTAGPDTAYSTLVTITINPLPTATLSPSGTVNLCPPTTSQLLTSATNASSPTYIWRKNGVILGGETNPTYSATSSGSYTVSITDGVTTCSKTSLATVVAFNTQPAMPLVTPSSVTMCISDPAVLLTASGSGGGTGTTTQSSGTISLAIPDFSSTGVNNTLTIGGVQAGSTIDSVIVTFNITHTFSGDVEVNLEAPNGQIINLEADQGSTSGLGFVNTRATSNGSAPAFSSGSNPFTGTFKADATAQTGLIGSPAITTQVFSNLFSTINGGWKIRVYDDANLDNGTLVNWTIKISYHEPAATYTWSPNGAGSGLFTDAAATMVYTGTPTPTVFAKPTSPTTYTVTATNGGGCTNTKTVVVTVLGPPNAGTVSGITPLCVAATDTYISTGDAGGVWSSTSPTIASVNAMSGLVTALLPGTTFIKYTVSNVCGSPDADSVSLTVNSIEVANTNDSGPGSLRDIIACAGSGATITFAPALTGMTIGLISEIIINKNITLAGPGALNLTISGNNTSRIFRVLASKTLTVQNLALKDSNVPIDGGAVLVEGNLTLDNVLFENNFQGGIPKSWTTGPMAIVEIINNVDVKF